MVAPRWAQRAVAVAGAAALVLGTLLWVTTEREVNSALGDALTEVGTTAAAVTAATTAGTTPESALRLVLAGGHHDGVRIVSADGVVTTAGISPPTSAPPNGDDAMVTLVETDDGRVLHAVAPLGDGSALHTVDRFAPPDTVRALTALAASLAVGLVALVPLGLLERRRDRRATEQERALTGVLTREGQVLEDFNDVQRMKTDFLTGVSHSLRTALHVIAGTVQTLERRGEALTPMQRAQLTRAIAEQTARLETLVQDLLEVEELATTVIPDHRTDVLVVDVLHTVRSRVDLGARVLVTDCADVTARITPAHLERVLVHLVRNAIAHTPVDARVAVRATRMDGGTELVVADDGPGIDRADRQWVFDPLSRVPKAGEASPGLGLGLAVVRRIARIHGGRAWVQTDEQLGGTAVHVWLPDDPGDPGVDPFDLTVVLDEAAAGGRP